MTDDYLLAARTRALLEHAVAGLDANDLNERIEYCRTHNEHGVRTYPPTDDDLIEFRWGGRTLAMVNRDVLLGDGPMQAEFVADMPDDWTDQ